MPSSGKKEPIEDLKEKLRSFFGPRDPQKKKDALPPQDSFQHLVFPDRLPSIYLPATILSFSKSGDDSLRPI